MLHDDVTAGQAVGIEAVLTFLVVLTVCSATDTERKTNDYGLGPLFIGLVYSAAHFMGVSVDCLYKLTLFILDSSVRSELFFLEIQ